MGRPSRKASVNVHTIMARKLAKETEDKIFYLEDGLLVKRLKGTENMYLIDEKTGKKLSITNATAKDLPILMHPSLYSSVKGVGDIKVNKATFKSEDTLIACSKTDILNVTDNITYAHCEKCPIRMGSEESLTKNVFCYTFCEVGLELQKLGVLYETKPRKRIDRGKRVEPSKVKKPLGKEATSNIEDKKGNIKDESVINAQKEVEKRQLKQLRLLYMKLVSPDDL